MPKRKLRKYVTLTHSFTSSFFNFSFLIEHIIFDLSVVQRAGDSYEMCRGTKFQNRHCTTGRRLPEATQLLSADHHTTTVPDFSSYEMIRCKNFKATRTLRQPTAGVALPCQQVAFMKHTKRSEM